MVGNFGPLTTNQQQTVGEYGPVSTAPLGMKTVMGEYGPVFVKDEPQNQNEYGGHSSPSVHEYGNVKTEVNEYGKVKSEAVNGSGTGGMNNEYGFKQENGDSFKRSEIYDPFSRRSESQSESDYDPAMPTEGDSPGKISKYVNL